MHMEGERVCTGQKRGRKKRGKRRAGLNRKRRERDEKVERCVHVHCTLEDSPVW